MSNSTHPLALNDRGERVADLQKDLGQLGYTIPQQEIREQVFGVGTEDALLGFQSKSGLRRTGILDEDVEAALARAVSIVETGRHQVEGRIFSEQGIPAANARVRLYGLGFGGTETRLGEVQADDEGFYAIPYDPAGRTANLEVRVLGLDGEEVSLSTTRFRADRYEMLNLVAPAGTLPLAPEYDRLSADLGAYLGEQGRLGDAEENGDRQDLTLLHRETGWDARLIALAAMADELGADTEISRDALYALFRVGLPTDKQLLARVGGTAVRKALDKAAEAGIAGFDAERIAEVEAAFDTFARTTRRTEKAPGALSTFVELLGKSGLNEEERGLFEDLYFTQRDNPDELWEKAREQGISEASIEGLRLQGKLACLTLNNAELAASLQPDVRSPDDLDTLVDLDLYRADTWKQRLDALARGENEEAPRDLIPPAYEGASLDDRRDAYATDLARKVRLSFPTQVVGRMIEKGDLSLGNGHDADVSTFLGRAVKQGFELGQTPVGPFLQQHQEQIFPDMAPAEAEAVAEDVKLLHRLYQITPSDESLQAISKPELGFRSAEDVAAFSAEEFIERFGEHFPSVEEARLVHQKAQQVTTVIYNFTIMGKQVVSSPGIYATSPPAQQIEEAKNSLIKRFPSLETLFGSLDFCECKHCRSVLSPAAYLVDLLHFLDPKKNVWTSFVEQWKSKHGNVAYPFKDLAAYTKFSNSWKKDPKHKLPNNTTEPVPVDKMPYDVLVLRRPDLPHIQLTCENTHTLLPYIDVVNEILEYYVANGKLGHKAARDTGKAKTAELLAEPQHVLSEAYDELKKAHYPLDLPFDLWLETARRFCDHFDTPLWQVLDLLRPTDKLFDAKTPYDREAVFVESLGISPREHSLFTASDPLDWHALYGYSDKEKAKAITELESAKTLARRLGVTYKELAELVQTSFVNPALDELALVWKLELEVGDVIRYFNNRGKTKYAAEKQAFEERLTAYDETYKLAANKTKSELEKLWDDGKMEKALLLEDTTGACDFGKTYLRFGDGDPADALVLLKINHFVRLWKRLGWSMEETDRVLQAFVPKGLLPLDGTGLGTALKAALLYLAHLQTLDDKITAGKGSRVTLLPLWSNLPTTGKSSLYAQLFLTRSVLKDALVFDDPLGNYLSGTGHLLKDHLRTLQGVLNLTTDEIGRILLDAGKDMAPLFTLSWSSFQDDLKDGTVSVDLTKEFKANEITLSNGANLKTVVTGAEWRITDGQNQYDLEKVGETLAVYDPSTAVKLTLANVSLLYRYGLLAKALNLSVHDLIRLKSLSGLDPFKPLSSDAPKALADDYPFMQTLRFVELAEKVETSGFSVAELEYLLRHRFDPVGPYRASAEVPLTLTKQLATGLRQIYAEHAVPADAASLSDDALKQKLALVMTSEAVAKLFGMLAGTLEYKVEVKNVSSAGKLDPDDFVDEPATKVSYDETTQSQRLTYTGVLTDSKKSFLNGKYLSKLLEDLLNKVQKQAKEFFEKHLRVFLAPADFDLLFDDTLSDSDKRAKLAKAFLPFLQQRLSRQHIVQTLTASMKADATLIEALLTDPGQPVGYLGEQAVPLTRLLSDPSQPTKPLVDAFAAAKEQGVTATYYDNTGAYLEAATLADADTSAKNTLGTSKPVTTSRALLEGWLEVPATGTYRFSFSLETGTAAELRFAHLPDPLLRDKAGSSSAAATAHFGSVELKAGIPYRFALDARNIGKGDVAILVQSADLPKDRLNRLTLYPQAAVERLQRAWILSAKTLRLLEVLGLSERELRHFVTYGADIANLDLSELPTRVADDTSTGAVTLFAQFVRLANYAALKRDLSAGSDDLIRILENGRRRYPASADAVAKEKAMLNDLCKRVAAITRRNVETVRATVEHLGFSVKATTGSNALSVAAPDFVHEKGLRKLWKLLQVMESFGASADTLAGWTGIVSNQKPETRYAAIAAEMKGTIKSRYQPEDWQRIAQSIFDRLRRRQRDALVAHVMHEEGFARMEELFEYFLLDPGMEPIVQTSRIQLAISSVQLFVQRCLLNLEPLVDPSVINAKHWKWMKRYRVWEANRKIFLFPENWLEPEFRDDRTHLFQELESALLQGDVSNDLAENAFFDYLKRLEDLARLEIVTMYCEEKPLAISSNTLHLIGRTYNQPHKYFYRRYAEQMWTPWEPVTAEIEGDHIVAAFWRDRLHLFWVIFLDKAEKKPAGTKNGSSNKNISKMSFGEIDQAASAVSQKAVDVQLNWTEYFQGEWTTREASGINKPLRIKLGEIDKDFDKSKIYIYVSEDDGEENAITVNLDFSPVASQNTKNTAFHLISKNSTPEIGATASLRKPPYPTIRFAATRRVGIGPFRVTFREQSITENSKEHKTPTTEKIIFKEGLQDWHQRKWKEFSLVTCSNSLQYFPDEVGTLISPFFYLGKQHTFFVEPTLAETKIVEWKKYVMSPVLPTEKLFEDEWWEQVPIDPKVPIFKEPLASPVGSLARFKIQAARDWITDPGAALEFKGQPIGKDGRLGSNLESAAAAGGELASGNELILIDGGGLQSVELNGDLYQ